MRELVIPLLTVILTGTALAEEIEINYDEAKVPDYSLPNPLQLDGGEEVVDAETWRNLRRGEILALFESHMFGRVPIDGQGVRFGEAEIERGALDGTAIRKQLKVYFDGSPDGPTGDLLIYLPVSSQGPVPTLVGLNFGGNHRVDNEPGIWLTTSWVRDRDDETVVDHRATEKGRGASRSRWPAREVIARGYGMATMYYGDIDPDFDDGFQNGVHSLAPADDGVKRDGDAWGSIAAWAWGLSRVMDYFETDDDVDHNRVAVLGHSRLGKTALWAGARDERFALVISNNSGCGGAALSRRRFGENLARINSVFPHWFCRNFHQYNHNEDSLPFDQHMLAALVAPRPLYVASATEDTWADPKGEFLSLQHASSVYELLGKRGLGDVAMPAADQPVQRDVAYHLRTGKHDITPYDWQCFMDFADRHFGRKGP